MPCTASNCSTLRSPPRLVRCSMMRSASVSPTPGSAHNSPTVAVFTSSTIAADRAGSSATPRAGLRIKPHQPQPVPTSASTNNTHAQPRSPLGVAPSVPCSAFFASSESIDTLSCPAAPRRVTMSAQAPATATAGGTSAACGTIASVPGPHPPGPPMAGPGRRGPPSRSRRSSR